MPRPTPATPLLPKRLGIALAAILTTTIAVSGAPLPPPAAFVVESVATDLSNPVEMSIAGDLVFIAELHGKVKVVNLDSGKTHLAAHLQVDYRKRGDKWDWDVESGLIGIAAAPDFATSRWVYLCYSKPGGDAVEHNHVVSRFRFRANALALDSEQVIIEIPALRHQDRIHEAGSLAFGPDGCLYVSIGDNQVHTRYLYSARTSTDTSVLNGKILRIRPGTTGGYTIPEGNLFPPGTPKTRPEIYVMGCRNPYRITVDQRTGYLYWGENGPADYYSGNLTTIPKERLPLGYDEFNQARRAGYFGWPFFIGQNEPYPTCDFTTGTVTGAFDPAKPINDLPENRGLRELPPPRKPMIWYSHPPSSEFPSLGRGGASAIAGEVYYHKPSRHPDQGGLPQVFDHHWFIADYSRGWLKAVALDADERLQSIRDFPINSRLQTPINVKFNRHGQLFVLQYGRGGWDPNNGGSLLRISYRPDRVAADAPTPLPTPAADAWRGLPPKHVGTALIKQNNCAACHRTTGAMIGPSFEQIVARYAAVAGSRQRLADTIRNGSKGAWDGTYEMPPHTYLTNAQTTHIVDAIFSLELADHQARGAAVRLTRPPSTQYPGSGSAGLVDGAFADAANLKQDWLGFHGQDLIATIELDKVIPVREVAVSLCQVVAAGVFLPSRIEILTSTDDLTYEPAVTITTTVPEKQALASEQLSARFRARPARYLRVIARNRRTIPAWHQAHGRPAWLFVDEILVNPAPPTR